MSKVLDQALSFELAMAANTVAIARDARRTVRIEV
jgi:hypothetical protein